VMSTEHRSGVISENVARENSVQSDVDLSGCDRLLYH
jgi:hypothetical protein